MGCPILSLCLLIALSIACQAGGCIVTFVGFRNFARAVGVYDDLSSFSSALVAYVFAAAVVAIVIEVLLVYSIFSNTLRVHKRHCCGNDGAVYDAMGGYAMHRNDEKTLRLFFLELGCVAYSHVLLGLAWAATIFGTLQTVCGAVFGTIAYAVGVLCDAGTTAWHVVAQSADRLPILNDLFDGATGLDLTNTTVVGDTLCAEPPQLRQAGVYLIVGPAIILLALVILLVAYSAIYKVHQMQGEARLRGEYYDPKEVELRIGAGRPAPPSTDSCSSSFVAAS